ncbi:hypothetical protein HOY82DRAFT_539403 [Tuber indicum]|nr:hypothetical protein HOY82DRAFT_539403 [Tuber indicum]
MVLQITINTIVFTDEMWVEFGKPQHQHNVSSYCGTDWNTYVLYNKDKEGQPICLMFWGAITQGFRSSYHIWEPDIGEDKRSFQEIVNQENQVQQEQQILNQQQAQIIGTWQYVVLTRVNNDIENLNQMEG